jgi:Fe-S-cluster-containing hydrogenase component 2
MPYTTTSQYISWDRCQTQCPTKAIKQVNQHYCIDLQLCNGCQGYALPACGSAFFSSDRCVSVADKATNADIIPNLAIFIKDSNDYWESWFTTYARLVKQFKTSQQPIG